MPGIIAFLLALVPYVGFGILLSCGFLGFG